MQDVTKTNMWKIKAMKLQADILMMDMFKQLIETQDEFGNPIRIIQPQILTTYEHFTIIGVDEKALLEEGREEPIMLYHDWYMTYEVKDRIL
ncbi:hypothetical protein EVB64_089 [Rhizobium phage RHph_TM61]|nr:hypothetical protein EVB64_089 [Rhizobium phage RHph_TM61]